MATSVLQLQPEEQTLRKLTIAEYHKLVEAGVLHPKERVELLDGLLVQMAPIGPRHQSIVDQLTEELAPRTKADTKSALEGQFRSPISTNRSPTWCSSREACPPSTSLTERNIPCG